LYENPKPNLTTGGNQQTNVFKQEIARENDIISKSPVVETHLDNRVSPRRGFDSPSAAFCLIMSSVMSFGVNLNL